VSNLQNFFEDDAPKVFKKISPDFPEGVVVVFHIDGPDGGAWQFNQEDGSIGPMDDQPKDCEIWCSSIDFKEILNGGLSPKEAFYSGRLQLVGDLGLALKFQQIFTVTAA